MPHLNWLAVLAAALSTFVIGGLWYSPALFGRPWMQVNKITDADLKTGNTAKIFGFSFLLAVRMAANLAAFLADPETNALLGRHRWIPGGFRLGHAERRNNRALRTSSV